MNYGKWFLLVIVMGFLTVIPFNVMKETVNVYLAPQPKTFPRDFIISYNESNFEDFKSYVMSKYPHLKSGKPKRLQGDICQRFRSQPSQEKLVLESFWGPKSLNNTKDVTFVTQLTFTRLKMLIQVLKNWEGPVSACIYLTWTELRHLQTTLQNTNEFATRSNIVLQVVLQNEEFYPVNFLRNVALNGSLTQYVFLADVDFVPSIGSHKILKQYILSGRCDNKQVLVVPAFEFLKAGLPYPQSKQELLKLWDKKKVQVFHENTFKVGHASTNTAKWRSSTTLYKITPRGSYEPYFVMKKTDVPAYREGFLGRSHDKISFTLEVFAQGFKVLGLPDVFCIHIPHVTMSQTSYLKCAGMDFAKYKSLLKKLYPKTMTKYAF